MSGKKHGIIFKIFKTIFCLILVVIVAAVGMIGFLSFTEYKPDDRENVEVTGESMRRLRLDREISLLTFNIGYGALGDNADFFMDGGESVTTADENRVNQNLNGILGNIKEIDPDILLVQEIDKSSSRSYKINEYEKFKNELTKYAFSFANNFKVAFLPYPVPPIGKVDSGIATGSVFGATSAERVQLPIPFSWPMRMANLKRCVLISRIPVEKSDKELVIFNLHLEAYDSGEGKIAQTNMLAELLKDETEKGNYVIAGGDFNQIFSNADKNAYEVKEGMWAPGEIDVEAFGEGFDFLMDESVPSCRSLDKAYKDADKKAFQYYLIDGFIVSDNIEVKELKTQDLGFKDSDHNPVLLKAVLKGEQTDE
ncbi:MAG: endonuclease [Clostridia bacterium]|nr:endonuclease [Clostridia bacterium]